MVGERPPDERPDLDDALPPATAACMCPLTVTLAVTSRAPSGWWVTKRSGSSRPKAGLAGLDRGRRRSAVRLLSSPNQRVSLIPVMHAVERCPVKWSNRLDAGERHWGSSPSDRAQRDRCSTWRRGCPDEEVGDPEGGDAVEDSGCFTLLDRAEGEQVARVDDGVDLPAVMEFLGQRVLAAAVHVRDDEQPQRDGGVSG